jgi:hypothetical protein
MSCPAFHRKSKHFEGMLLKKTFIIYMKIIHFVLGYLAYFMLKRQLRYSVDSFAAFLRLGAQCWGPRIADPDLEVKLAEEDPGKKEERIRLEAEITAKALKKRDDGYLPESQEGPVFCLSASPKRGKETACSPCSEEAA